MGQLLERHNQHRLVHRNLKAVVEAGVQTLGGLGVPKHNHIFGSITKTYYICRNKNRMYMEEISEVEQSLLLFLENRIEEKLYPLRKYANQLDVELDELRKELRNCYKLENGREYILKVEYVESKEVEYLNKIFNEYCVKFNNRDEVYKIFVLKKMDIIVGDYLKFNLEEDFRLKNVKIVNI